MKKIIFSSFNLNGDENVLTLLIEVLKYVKDRPGYATKLIDLLDQGRVHIQETNDQMDMDHLELKGGQARLVFEHCHSKYCYDGGCDTECGISPFEEITVKID